MNLPADPLPTKFKGDTPEQYLERLLDFCKEYHWLIHVLAFNFITHKEWEKFSSDWQDALMNHMQQAGDEWAFAILELTKESSDYSKWPPSLGLYLESIRDLALPRTTRQQDQQKNISRHIRGGMSDKKVHEVELLSQLIKKVADQHNVSSIIDLGSGQGYLSRALAFECGFEVLAVDMSEVQTQGALRFDTKALRAQGKAKEHPNLKHVTEKVTPENITEVLNRCGSSTDKQWLVTGLHTCGDLSPMIFRLFAESQKVSCMVNVGCCYNALTNQGFPMSSFLKNKSDMIHVGSTAKVLACHSPSRWHEEGIQCIRAFDNYYFRALLMELLVKKGLADISDPPRLGRIKQNKAFVPFVKASLKRLKLPENTITEEEAQRHYLQAKERQVDKQFVALWILRGLLAPIIESIILMDRWLYLKEINGQTSKVWMYPLFDLDASPRNMVYVASKP
ncbi:Protein RRNAD1 [Choanephora cucurbitarum]|uniref:Protein RRNAD1 n=1 Tax=Choanephora cucurbitarum TaxID=101091 RepID=A0A1C7NP86_9FUNG|nr:Protein RRNAD1 [Choanephora cucurbitarum]